MCFFFNISHSMRFGVIIICFFFHSWNYSSVDVLNFLCMLYSFKRLRLHVLYMRNITSIWVFFFSSKNITNKALKIEIDDSVDPNTRLQNESFIIIVHGECNANAHTIFPLFLFFVCFHQNRRLHDFSFLACFYAAMEMQSAALIWFGHLILWNRRLQSQQIIIFRWSVGWLWHWPLFRRFRFIFYFFAWLAITMQFLLCFKWLAVRPVEFNNVAISTIQRLNRIVFRQQFVFFSQQMNKFWGKSWLSWWNLKWKKIAITSRHMLSRLTNEKVNLVLNWTKN